MITTSFLSNLVPFYRISLRLFFLALFSVSCFTQAQDPVDMTGVQTFKVKKIQLIDFVAYPDKGIDKAFFDAFLGQHISSEGELMTLDGLEYIVDYINAIYQDAGFTFTKAVLQAQEVIDKTVKIKIVSGQLSKVDVRENNLYKKSVLEDVFSSFKNNAIYKPDIEQQLLLLNDYPGLNSFAYFSRGRRLGQTNLNVKVENENALQGSLQLDNYGTTSTGEHRLTGSMTWNNPTGIADQLSLALMTSNEVEGNIYGALRYKLPLFSPRWWLSVSASNNQFDVGGDFSSLEIEGDVAFYSMALDYKMFRSNNFNQIFSTSLDYKSSITDSAIFRGDFYNEEVLHSLSFLSTSNQLISAWKFSHEWVAELLLGQYQSDVGTLKKGYTLARWQYSASWLLAEKSSWFYSDMSMQIKGQFSGAKRLPDLERFSTTGPYAVRALAPSFYSADEAIYTSINWRWYKSDWLGNNSFSKLLRPTLFIDYTQGQQYLLNERLNSVDISALGFKLDFNWESLQMSLSAARTLSINASGFYDSSIEEDHSQLYMHIAYFMD